MKFFFANHTKSLLLILFLGINASLFAQDSLQIVMGTVRNSSSYEAISFALVRNEMLHTKIIADEKGAYVISINKGDLLKITAVGYEDGFYIINDSSDFINNFPIQLKPRIYELKEFVITPYKTILQFKNAITQLDLPENKATFLWNIPTIKNHLPDENDDVLGSMSFTSPISAIYNAFSHKGKAAKKYRSLMVNDYDSKMVKKKFNREFVATVVPMFMDEELDAFIEFCKFDFKFLLNASDYELVAAIQQKYAQYLQIEPRQKHI